MQFKNKLIFLLSAVTIACDSPQNVHNSEDIFDETTYPENVFTTLKAGVQNKYIAFEGVNYRADSSLTWAYTGDTVIVETVDHDGPNNWIHVIEKLTSGSAYLKLPLNRYRAPFYGRTESDYFIEQRNDSLFFHFYLKNGQNSFISLIFGIYSDWRVSNDLPKLPLQPIRKTHADTLGWKTTLPYCECYQQGYLEDFHHISGEYGRLNVVIDDVAMQGDGPGTTWIYSKNAGLIRTYVVDWWTQKSIGWDLLPPE